MHSIYAYKKGSPKYSIPVVLPRPIFRYAVVYPLDYISKMRGRLEFWKRDPSMASVQEQIQKLEALAFKEKDQNKIARRVLDMMRASVWKSGVPPPLYPDHMLKIPVEEHPKIMKDLILDKEHKTYYIREELYRYDIRNEMRMEKVTIQITYYVILCYKFSRNLLISETLGLLFPGE